MGVLPARVFASMRLSPLLVLAAVACSLAPPSTRVEREAPPAAAASSRDARTPAAGAASGDARPPAAAPAEFRAAWVATVDNIDFPSRPGLPVAALRSELDAIVDRAAELHLNALVFQVRPAADAFYASSLEPWSEWLTGVQGQAPAEGFDPLAHIIARCHQQGLQLHAWFNPYRCGHPAAKSAPDPQHVTQRAPQLCVRYERQHWMDPGNPTSSTWSLAVIQDVVRRYDIDGVHLDDYFYPYPEHGKPFDDDASYAAYGRRGGNLPRDAWRRANIDDFVRRLYELVHREKPWLWVGISPFGIARPGVPAGIRAGIDQYRDLAADVPKWLAKGWVDYLTPQLYWPIDKPEQSFDVLLAWWHTQNPLGRAIWPGLNASAMLAAKPPWRVDELRDQLQRIREAPGAAGSVLFSFRALRQDLPQLGSALRQQLYREIAPVPRLAWLPAPPR